MKKISEIISKPVYSKASGALVGYVLNVEFSSALDKLTGFVVVDEESEVEGRVDAAGVTFGEQALLLSEESNLIYGYDVGSSNPIGKVVLDARGKGYGKVRDVFLKGKRVEGLLCDGLYFHPKNICVNGPDALIVFSRRKLQKPFSFEEAALQPEQHVQISAPLPKEVAPFRVTPDARSLIGKMASRDIFGLNNELIIKKHEIITQKKINEAKKHNKLNLLFYNSK